MGLVKVSKPLITVCIPAFNASTTIIATIKSVLNQSYSNFELYVVDNCSNDTTYQLAQSIQDTRLTVLQNESNVGMAGNFNKCLELVQGEYFKLLCADDLICPDFLESHLEAFLKNPEVVLTASARAVIDSRNKVLMVRKYSKQNQLVRGLAAIKKTIRSGGNPIGEPSAVMIRSSAISKVGQFIPDNAYALDLDYWLRLLLHGDLYIFEKPMSSFLVHAGSESVALAQKQHQLYLRFVITCAQNPDFGLKDIDIKISFIRSKINSVLRRLIYSCYV